MNQKILHQYCENALAILKSQFESTKILKHNTTSGQVREKLLKDFMSDHLPELVSILSGQIIDSSNKYSRQQDIVLVLKSMPRLRFSSGDDLIFIEGVVATFEIKTKLDINVLEKIGENISSVRNLTPVVIASLQTSVTHSWPSEKILTSIITYGGNSLDSIIGKLNSLGDKQKPDLLLDLSKGLLIKNNGLLVPKQTEFDYIKVDDPTHGFKYFLIFLTEISGTLSSRGVLWRNYI